MFGIGVIVFSVVFVGLSHRGSRSDKRCCGCRGTRALQSSAFGSVFFVS